MAKKGFSEHLQEELKKYGGIMVPVKAGLAERLLLKKMPVTWLHPNPEDEFSWPEIGPNPGIINKYIIDSNSPACFEYMDEEIHRDGEPCFHCKCEKCGKLIHLHCDEMIEIQSHMMEKHQFMLDPLRTVFYGICEECRCSE